MVRVMEAILALTLTLTNLILKLVAPLQMPKSGFMEDRGGGGSTDGLTQYKQHRGISGFPSYIECDNNGNAVTGTGKLLLTVEETGLSPYFGTGDTVIYGNPSGTGTAGDISVVYGKTSGSLRKITISGTGDGGQGYSSFNCPLSVHTDGSTQIEYYSY